MGYNIFRRISFFIILFSMLFQMQVFSEEKSYTFSQDDKNIEYTQILRWSETAFTSSYEILIEKKNDNGEWIKIVNPNAQTNASDTSNYVFKTTETFLEVSLSAGEHRYNITNYNILKQVIATSEWFNFTVKRATKPEIEKVFPKNLYLEENSSGIFTVKGENLIFDVEKIYSTSFTLQSKTDSTKNLTGKIISSLDNEVQIQFDSNELIPDEYILHAQNPGGLKNSFSTVKVANEKNFGINISLGYNPAFFPITGNLKDSLNNWFIPLGAKFSIGYIPFITNYGSVGIELTSYFYNYTDKTDDYKISALLFPSTINIVYQYPLINNKLILDSHIGFGFNIVSNVNIDYDNHQTSPKFKTMGTVFNVGIAAQYYFYENIFLNAGIDYLFTSLKNAEMHIISPTIAIGMHF